MRIEWTVPAETDLDELFDYIGRDSAVYAEQFVDRILESVTRLADQPKMGRTVPEADSDDVRELVSTPTTQSPRRTHGAKGNMATTVFRFKVTLLDVKPPVWRLIAVQDCSLDRLHEHIQTAMGWTNSHLHHFRIGEQLYGDPLLMEEMMDELGYADSTTTMLHELIPDDHFRCVYEYDFGDSWAHEIVLEARGAPEASCRYPICLDGARACPPEDVGGIPGYVDFLEVISDAMHERHEEILSWVGGHFDPDEFDPMIATQRMQAGLLDWQSTV